jgi:hypothetical protein
VPWMGIMSVARVPVLVSSKAALFVELEVVAPIKAWAKRSWDDGAGWVCMSYVPSGASEIPVVRRSCNRRC